MNELCRDVSQVRAWVAAHQTEQPTGCTGFFRQTPTFTSEQLAKHDAPEDGWVLDFSTRKIYCATPLFKPDILPHPFLQDPNMRERLASRLGGRQDVHEDLHFHSGSRQQKLLTALCIGELAPHEPLPKCSPR